MPKAIRVRETGAPDVMRLEDVDQPTPGPGEALIRHTAIGINYIDLYSRKGLYKPPYLPFTPGDEGAGIVEAVGPDVAAVKPGDRVAYVTRLGSYSEMRLAPADRLVKLPEAISDRVAASIMLKGMTAHYLLRRTFKVGPGTTLLFHAAAGGVGLLACQWAKSLGARVIGTVGSQAKAELALSHGCDYAIDTSRESFAVRVREITDGEGCDVVYDSIGNDSYPASLDCLKPLGLWVVFGQSSGPLPPIDTQVLAQKGSLFMTRPTLYTYIAKREELEAASADLFEIVASGAAKVEINQTFPLAEAARAHEALEGRRTTGASLLLP